MKNKVLHIISFFVSLVIPLSIYIILSLYLKRWIVDDGGISFSYSRSLAEGYGLVPQPGAEKVEGYSNFLWVLLFTPFFIFNCFHFIATPKIVSTILVGILFYFIIKICKQFKTHPIVGFIINTLIAINTPFIIWTTSGLENPLYALLIIILIFVSVKYLQKKNQKLIYTGAVISLLIAITRPDGIVFACIFPIAILGTGDRFLDRFKSLMLYTFSITFLIGGFLLFRFMYFHDTVPNTYYAKEASTIDVIKTLLFSRKELIIKFHSIFHSLSEVMSENKLMVLVCILLIIFLTEYVFLRGKMKPYLILFFVWGVSLIIYMLLPYDYMKEYRFATPFVVVSYVFFGLVLAYIPSLLPHFKKYVVVILFTLLGTYSWFNFNNQYKRLLKFSRKPTVPYYEIKEAYVDKFDKYAESLKINNASILLPDVGATYFYSKLKVYDAAGLCNKTIAQGIFKKDRKIILDYIFKQVKPTFIHLHDGWSEKIRPDEYIGFRTEYITIYETISIELTEACGVNLYSGDYIRKDVINQQNEPILKAIISKRRSLFD